MNSVTQKLLDQLPRHRIWAFVVYWERFEEQALNLIDVEIIRQEEIIEFGKTVDFLTFVHPRYENGLRPHWKEANVEGNLVLQDPFKQLITLDAKDWLQNKEAGKILPVAREVLNNFMRELIEHVEEIVPSGFIQEDQAIIDAVTSRYKHTKHTNHTLKSLFIRWEQITFEVKNGYTLTIYDYTNDLSTRRILELIYSELSDQGKDLLMDALNPHDDRFRRSTIQIDRGLGVGNEDNWWRFRMPKVLSSELRKDFESRGII